MWKKKPKTDTPGFKKKRPLSAPPAKAAGPAFRKKRTSAPAPVTAVEDSSGETAVNERLRPIVWSPRFSATDDSGIKFHIGFQWRGAGCRGDSIMLLYRTWFGDRYLTYTIGAVPRCALAWLVKGYAELALLDGPPHPAKPHRAAEIAELLRLGDPQFAEIVETELKKEERYVSDKETRSKPVDGERRRKAVPRPKRRKP